MKNPGARLKAAKLEGRSPIYRWLYEHYTEFAPVLFERRPPWTALAKTAQEAGLKSATRQSVRMAWMRVARDREKPPRELKPSARPVSVTLPTEPPRPLIVRPDRPRERQITSLRPSTPKE
jgi:hypothetical protein